MIVHGMNRWSRIFNESIHVKVEIKNIDWISYFSHCIKQIDEWFTLEIHCTCISISNK